MSVNAYAIKIRNGFNETCEFLKPIGDLFIRFWLAKAFFLSGVQKLESWQTTLLLFQFEYTVPLFSPYVSAIIAVVIEILVPPFLLLGLGGRFPAFILFIFNILALSFYSFLWTPAGYIGLKDHISWGLLLLILVLHGPGKLSLDQLLLRMRARKDT